MRDDRRVIKIFNRIKSSREVNKTKTRVCRPVALMCEGGLTSRLCTYHSHTQQIAYEEYTGQTE